LPKREFLLLAMDEHSNVPRPQAPIIEDALYGKDPADYVAFSSSCQPVGTADAAKRLDNKHAIP
jgi:hypothetical protein